MAAHADSPWSAPDVVAGFASSLPNEVLMRFAGAELERATELEPRPPVAPRRRVALDLGCGAGRNALPLAQLGFEVIGFDNSLAMLQAARERSVEVPPGNRLRLALAEMDRLPLPGRSCDFVVAHGIWNLARSVAEFRRAVGEAARVAAPGAALFVFTFSRHTLPPDAAPVPGEPFVFTQFSGRPQCFLTAGELFAELAEVGFAPEPAVPLTEYNAVAPGSRTLPDSPKRPVLYEAAFRMRQ